MQLDDLIDDLKDLRIRLGNVKVCTTYELCGTEFHKELREALPDLTHRGDAVVTVL